MIIKQLANLMDVVIFILITFNWRCVNIFFNIMDMYKVYFTTFNIIVESLIASLCRPFGLGFRVYVS